MTAETCTATSSSAAARRRRSPLRRTDSRNPEDLWRWLDERRAEDIEGLAIPHNSNGSNGHMFKLETVGGEPLDAAYADLRMRNEPLVEMTQVKGTSETHPLLSPNDEWADFEIFPYRIATNLYSEPKGSYVREAYMNGLVLQETQGFNPFRFGVVGATDTHNSGGTPEEDNFHGKVGRGDGSGPAARFGTARRTHGGRREVHPERLQVLGRLGTCRGLGGREHPRTRSTTPSAARRPLPPAAPACGSGSSPATGTPTT